MISIPDQIAGMAKRVSQLRPDYQNHERYFEERSEIEHDLRRLARDMEKRRG